MEYKEEVKRVFNIAAPKFDKIGTPFFQIFGKSLVDKIEFDYEMKVLDVACGNGSTLIPTAKLLENSGEVTGIDIAPNMIEQLIEKIMLNNLSNARAGLMDAENLQFPDKYFDVVICGFGLFFFHDFLKAIEEIKRVLKDGGIFVFSTWNKKYRMTWLMEEMGKYIPDIESVKRGVTYNNGIVIDNLYSISGIKKILNYTNLELEALFTNTIEVVNKNEDEWIEKWWHSGFRLYFELISDEDYPMLEKSVRKNLQKYRSNGNLTYNMSAFFVFTSKK